jgi:hypothetical protein
MFTNQVERTMKKNNEITFLIYPVHKLGYMAPALAVTLPDTKDAYSMAIKEAKQRSRLSDFPEWSFH